MNDDAARHWHEDRRTIRRYEHRGIDHSSPGIVLAEVRHGNEVAFQLVWFKGCETPACGVRGFGHIYRPAHLTIINGRGYSEGRVFDTGRVTSARLLEHAKRIDGVMGEGLTALVDPKRTLVVIGNPDASEKTK